MATDDLELLTPHWQTDLPAPPDGQSLVVVAARLSRWTPTHEEMAASHLSDDEQRRAARFRFLDDVRRHLLGRLIARTLLGHWSGRAPSDLRIEPGPHEKPRAPDLAYRFNVSHGGDHVVAVFSQTTAVGIDVEPRERKAEQALARSVLTDHEFDHWERCPTDYRARWFMHVWTTKESLIKATGEGLYRGPTTIECQFEGLRATGFRRLAPADTEVDVGAPNQWRPEPFDIGDDGVACVTWRGGDRTIAFARYTAEPLRDLE